MSDDLSHRDTLRSARVRPLLVLDAGGVLVADPVRAAVAGGALPGRLRAAAVTMLLARRFHAGLLGEPAMRTLLGADRFERMRTARTGDPLVDAGTVAGFAEHADVWVLSNHRHDWLTAALDAAGHTPHLDRILVSDQLGVAKPDPTLYRIADRLTRPGQPVVYVDDRAVNRFAARQFGWRTVDAGPGWPERVHAILRTLTHP